METHTSSALGDRVALVRRRAFPERAALNQLVGTFLTSFYVTVADWVDWASRVVDDWPEDPTDAPFDVETAEEAVRRAERIVTLLDPDRDPVERRTT